MAGIKTYTLHLPAHAAPGDPSALERAVLVRDGFSWSATVFQTLWFLFQRLWLAALLIFVLSALIGFALARLDLPPPAVFLIALLLSLLLGLEAESLRRWTLTRRGLPAVDVVAARDRDEAETMIFSRWLARGTAPTGAAGPLRPPPIPRQRADEPVLGLFPEADRWR